MGFTIALNMKNKEAQPTAPKHLSQEEFKQRVTEVTIHAYEQYWKYKEDQKKEMAERAICIKI